MVRGLAANHAYSADWATTTRSRRPGWIETQTQLNLDIQASRFPPVRIQKSGAIVPEGET